MANRRMSFRKPLRLLGFVALMLLASVGIGLTGAAPMAFGNRQRFIDTKPKIELVERKKDEAPEKKR